ncbi:MAG: 16S rRNA (cytidine(1402)-2'-O)-methyltransferase [Hyphomonadaceae bacterium]
MSAFFKTRLGLGWGAPSKDDPRFVMSNPSNPSDAPDPSGEALLRPSANPALEPGLYVVATPIGNLRDITLRAIDTLQRCDLVFAEDTRVTGKLFHAHGVRTRLQAYHDHNAEAARAQALEALAEGRRVALVSDAGTPLISDPGFKLVRAAAAAGHRVIPIPGASAALAALMCAGLPTDRFLFAGFPPAKDGARGAFFEELSDIRATLVFYETGPRLTESLAAMARAFGAREAAVARELTKLFEEVRRAPLDALAADYAAREAPKGEIVVLVGPPQASDAPDAEVLDAALRNALKTLSVKDAAQEIAQRFGLSRRDLYARALALKDEA